MSDPERPVEGKGQRARRCACYDKRDNGFFPLKRSLRACFGVRRGASAQGIAGQEDKEERDERQCGELHQHGQGECYDRGKEGSREVM